MNDELTSTTDFDALDPLREQYRETLISTRLLRQELARDRKSVV